MAAWSLASAAASLSSSSSPKRSSISSFSFFSGTSGGEGSGSGGLELGGHAVPGEGIGVSESGGVVGSVSDGGNSSDISLRRLGTTEPVGVNKFGIESSVGGRLSVNGLADSSLRLGHLVNPLSRVVSPGENLSSREPEGNLSVGGLNF